MITSSALAGRVEVKIRMEERLMVVTFPDEYARYRPPGAPVRPRSVRTASKPLSQPLPLTGLPLESDTIGSGCSREPI
jgi:hypothetical protein